MPDYRLLAARRADDGTIGDALLEELLTAANQADAIKKANARDWSSDPEEANAFWLLDEHSRLIWSLRRADPKAVASPLAEP